MAANPAEWWGSGRTPAATGHPRARTPVSSRHCAPGTRGPRHRLATTRNAAARWRCRCAPAMHFLQLHAPAGVGEPVHVQVAIRLATVQFLAVGQQRDEGLAGGHRGHQAVQIAVADGIQIGLENGIECWRFGPGGAMLQPIDNSADSAIAMGKRMVGWGCRGGRQRQHTADTGRWRNAPVAGRRRVSCDQIDGEPQPIGLEAGTRQRDDGAARATAVFRLEGRRVERHRTGCAGSLQAGAVRAQPIKCGLRGDLQC